MKILISSNSCISDCKNGQMEGADLLTTNDMDNRKHINSVATYSIGFDVLWLQKSHSFFHLEWIYYYYVAMKLLSETREMAS